MQIGRSVKLTVLLHILGRTIIAVSVSPLTFLPAQLYSIRSPSVFYPMMQYKILNTKIPNFGLGESLAAAITLIQPQTECL
jgi:hypothetical protein